MQVEFKKAALIGCSGVDPTDVFSLARCEWLDELVLVGEGSEMLAASTNALLRHRSDFSDRKVHVEGISDARDSSIVLLNSCPTATDDSSADTSLEQRREKICRDVRALVRAGFDGVVLVIAEPVPILAEAALKASGLEPAQVIGIGVENEFQAAVHLAGATTTWCTGIHANKTFLDHCDPNCAHFESVVSRTRKGFSNGSALTANRWDGLALCATRICEAVLNDERELLPVCAWVRGEFGFSGVFVTVPCIIGRNGIERIVKLRTSNGEHFRIGKYAADVRAEQELLDRRPCPAQAIR